MPSRPLVYDDPDWCEAPAHTGEMGFGAIHDLRHAEPKGRPFQKHYGPLGFCVDPEAYKVKPKRKRRR
jgi:hypothetical protein